MNTTTPVISREIRIAARPATVFKFLVQPDHMAKWFGTAALEPRPGGQFEVDIEGKHLAKGEYTEVIDNEKVSFTFGWEGNPEMPPGSTRVAVFVTPDGDGTLLRLEHYDVPESLREPHSEGWARHLALLGEAASSM